MRNTYTFNFINRFRAVDQEVQAEIFKLFFRMNHIFKIKSIFICAEIIVLEKILI